MDKKEKFVTKFIRQKKTNISIEVELTLIQLRNLEANAASSVYVFWKRGKSSGSTGRSSSLNGEEVWKSDNQITFPCVLQRRSASDSFEEKPLKLKLSQESGGKKTFGKVEIDIAFYALQMEENETVGIFNLEEEIAVKKYCIAKPKLICILRLTSQKDIPAPPLPPPAEILVSSPLPVSRSQDAARNRNPPSPKKPSGIALSISTGNLRESGGLTKKSSPDISESDSTHSDDDQFVSPFPASPRTSKFSDRKNKSSNLSASANSLLGPLSMSASSPNLPSTSSTLLESPRRWRTDNPDDEAADRSPRRRGGRLHPSSGSMGRSIIRNSHLNDEDFVLLDGLQSSTEFVNGVAWAACLILKCFAHWKVLEEPAHPFLPKVTSTLFRIAKGPQNTSHALYWLSVTSNLIQWTNSFQSPDKFQKSADAFLSDLLKVLRIFYNQIFEIAFSESEFPAQKTILHLNQPNGSSGSIPPLKGVLNKYLDLFSSHHVCIELRDQFFRQFFYRLNLSLFQALLSNPSLCRCGTALQVKMSLTEVGEWIHSQGGPKISLHFQDQLKPFAQATDVLMLPKASLVEESTRKAVCPLLESWEVHALLVAFSPDEFDSEEVQPGLLASLSSQVTKEDSKKILEERERYLFPIDPDLGPFTSTERIFIEIPQSILQTPEYHFLKN